GCGESRTSGSASGSGKRSRGNPGHRAPGRLSVNGTLMLHRRLARDYDHRPDNAASRVYWASTAGMLRRLTVPSPVWRDEIELAA
ncbi:hypothetical protein ACIPEK_45050, partial [Streptomyces sp. NPDC088246]